MGWIKANDYIFKQDEVIAVGPLESLPMEGPGGGEPDIQAKVVLRAGYDFYLRGTVARRFREQFLARIAGHIHDHDAVQVSETRVLLPEEDAPGRVAGPMQANG
jgi:hypothetical protein